MTIEERLHGLEQAMPAQVAVRRWLVEAHSYGSNVAYRTWLDHQPPDAAPRRRVRAQAEATVWWAPTTAAREKPLAAWQAGRDAIFLIELVAELNARAEELLEPGLLRAETLEAELRLLKLEVRTGVSPEEAPSDRTCVNRWSDWCLACAALGNLLTVADAARTLLEDRYLGMPALFPELADDWARLLRRIEELATLAATAPTVPVGDRRLSWPPDPNALILLTPEARRLSAQAYTLPVAAVLVDLARARTLERFGDRAGANAILDRPIGRQAHAPSSD